MATRDAVLSDTRKRMGISPGSGPLALALAIVAAILLIGCSTSSPPDVGAMHIEPRLAARGIALRDDIDYSYRTGRAEEGRSYRVISDVVAAHVPIGSSFDDALAVLRAAGFTVGPRKPDVTRRGIDVQIARINFYRSFLFTRTDVFVKLTPVGNEDWTSVAQVYGEISVEFP